jgi:hypothetical protein
VQIGRQSDRQRAKRRLLINGATPRKGDEALAMAAEAVEEEKLQNKYRYKTSDYSSEDGEGIAYRIYKKAGDWWKCVFLHAGVETFVCISRFEGRICLYRVRQANFLFYMNILTIEVVMNGTSHFHFNKYNLL